MGTVTQHSWESKIYPNTTRDYYVYVPAQYDKALPATGMEKKWCSFMYHK
ncbi:MAG: hypothetical protein KTR30_15850 [Saprospiraceae bacterium]|nr:hypothetical protein [Saprospiraceae bacterium]